MATAPMLSTTGQQVVLQQAGAQETATLQKMKKNTAAATAAFAGAAFLFAICPPGGFGLLAASVTAGLGTIFAAKATGNVLTHKHLEDLKRNLSHPGVLGQMQKRARKLYKFAARAGIVSNIGAFVALGALVGAVLAPTLALPILYNLGLAAFGGGALAALAVNDAKKAAGELSETAQHHAVTTPAPANEDLAAGNAVPRALTRMASLKNVFGGVSAPAAEVKTPAPAYAPAKPRPAYQYA